MRRFAILLAALSAAGAAAAQPVSAPGEPPGILVEGNRARDRQIRDFVDALGDAPQSGQLSRFDWAVCPAALGLVPAQNGVVVARMRRVAEAAGIPVAEGGCRPNVVLIVAQDKDAMVSWLRRVRPQYFRDAAGRPVEVRNQAGPAMAWHVEGRLSADGVPASVNSVDGYYVTSTTWASRLQAGSRPHFLAAIVVVQADSLAGPTTVQLADYAAMRAFARIDPAQLHGLSAPTILTIFEAPMDSMVPITMTDWDFGYLRGLYASGENHRASQQRGEIRRRLRDGLGRGDDAGDQHGRQR